MNYAGFWERYFARLIDSFLSLPLFIINFCFLSNNSGVAIMINALIILYITLSVFYTGKTLGKKVMGLKVLKTNGNKVTLSNSFLREVFTIINVLVISLHYFIPVVKSYYIYLTIFLYLEQLAYYITVKRKAIHDLIGDTVVVYNEKR